LLSLANESFVGAFGVMRSTSKDDALSIVDALSEKMFPFMEKHGNNEYLLGANVCLVDFVFFEMIEYHLLICNQMTF